MTETRNGEIYDAGIRFPEHLVRKTVLTQCARLEIFSKDIKISGDSLK
jgi:hypothetical protein